MNIVQDLTFRKRFVILVKAGDFDCLAVQLIYLRFIYLDFKFILKYKNTQKMIFSNVQRYIRKMLSNTKDEYLNQWETAPFIRGCFSV